MALAVAAVAFLYSTVGHAGASGYIAVMVLFGTATADIKPTALMLNVLVAAVAFFQFRRAGHFSWRLFWPFALASVPAAWLGGFWQLPPSGFRPLVGAVLCLSALRFLLRLQDPRETRLPRRAAAMGVGAALGLLAGLTGTGGGIFLTPFLLLARWAKTHAAAAVSALFILVNSGAGLLGHVGGGGRIPPMAWALPAAALLGGAVGSYCGSRRFSVPTLRMVLALVLLLAGAKLILTR